MRTKKGEEGHSAGPVRFGPFILDLDTGELHRGGQNVPLRPLATRALVALVRSGGRLVSKDALRQELWGETTVEWSGGIHQVIRQIRRALGDENRRYVETVPRRGYRFLAPVEEGRASPPGRVAGSRRSLMMYAAGAATPVALVLLLLIACALLAR